MSDSSDADSDNRYNLWSKRKVRNRRKKVTTTSCDESVRFSCLEETSVPSSSSDSDVRFSCLEVTETVEFSDESSEESTVEDEASEGTLSSSGEESDCGVQIEETEDGNDVIALPTIQPAAVPKEDMTIDVNTYSEGFSWFLLENNPELWTMCSFVTDSIESLDTEETIVTPTSLDDCEKDCRPVRGCNMAKLYWSDSDVTALRSTHKRMQKTVH